jgi:hypothetical protein
MVSSARHVRTPYYRNIERIRAGWLRRLHRIQLPPANRSASGRCPGFVVALRGRLIHEPLHVQHDALPPGSLEVLCQPLSVRFGFH